MVKSESHKTAALLINLGSPDSTAVEDVRCYLDEFLSDPFVIDFPQPFRRLLLDFYILRTRPEWSAKAYQKIWRMEGSPLVFFTQNLTNKVKQRIGANMEIRFAMRYGSPSIRSAVDELIRKGVEKLIIFPLYPQYSRAATDSSVQAALREIKRWAAKPRISVVPPFFADERFIRCFSLAGKTFLDEFKPDHVLFSFHGLPERQIRKGRPRRSQCLLRRYSCCEPFTESNKDCYRAQCLETARRIARAAGLSPDQFTVSFQSRLGPVSWVKPYTDKVIRELGRNGMKKLLVFCPSFVADCLETLEEIGIRGRENFLSSGGEELKLVPSLNDTDGWVDAVCALIRAADDLPAEVPADGGSSPH